LNAQLKCLTGPDAPQSASTFSSASVRAAFGEQGMAKGMARNHIDLNYSATGDPARKCHGLFRFRGA
jgi:hypothetical protein